MSMDYVALSFVPGTAWAGLRELCGHDEQMVEGAGTAVAIQLLDRLLADGPAKMIEPGSAITLAAADRDRLLAAVYVRTFGSKIVGTITCRACANPFDLDFDLPDLTATLQPDGEFISAQENGQLTFRLADGRCFRLPTGEDELAVWHLAAEQAERELLRRCVIEGDPLVEPEQVQTAMNAVAPVLDLDLDALCPECGEKQSIHFDIQDYLLAALMSEQPRLTQEVHCIARAYGWGLSEILGLRRSQRRAYVDLIVTEASR